MRANSSNIFDFLKSCDTVFNIPVFQRNYDWEIGECEQLFSDIESIGKYNSSSHFIGSIVSNFVGTPTSPVYNIVDGQQRITSIMLFLRALYDSSSDEEFRCRIKNGFLMSNDSVSGKPRVKLKQVESDRAIYDKLMFSNEFDESLFESSDRKTNVYKNYMCFYELISCSDLSCDLLFDSLARLSIIDVRLDDENPQEVFESMNATGRPLTNTDLLRNYLFMGMMPDEQVDLHDRYWLRIEHNVGKQRMDAFMCTWLIYKRKTNNIDLGHRHCSINAKTLYRSFRRYYEGLSLDAKSVLVDLYKYSVIFAEIFDDNPSFSDKSKCCVYELIYELGAESTSVFLFLLMDKLKSSLISSDDFVEAVRIIISYVYRLRVVNSVSPSVQFFALAIQSYERCSKDMSFIDKVWYALTTGKGKNKFPNDLDFRNAFCDRDFYFAFSSQFVRYTLYKLEETRTRELVDKSDATIEHILPQDYSKWIDYLDSIGDTEYAKYIHRLGNLTLTKYNSELSNSLFAEKCELYKNSNYMLTRDIARRDRWGSKEIITRSSNMANRAKRIWPLREEYNKVGVVSFQYDVMDDDVRELFDEFVDLIHETYPSIRETRYAEYISYYGDKGLFSIIPRERNFILTLQMPFGFDDPKGFLSDKISSHKGIGNYMAYIRDEDDVWLALDFIDFVVRKPKGFSIGVKVRNERYGVGEIVAIRDHANKDDKYIRVCFDCGEKEFLLSGVKKDKLLVII